MNVQEAAETYRRAALRSQQANEAARDALLRLNVLQQEAETARKEIETAREALLCTALK